MDQSQRREARTGLVTGASGYVGGRVTQALLDAGWRVRVLARSPEKLPAELRERVEVIEGNATEPADVRAAVEGADVAWFLIHSMGGGDDFAERDRTMATVFAEAARDAGVSRLIYLGGLHPQGEELSPHLASRVEVGKILVGSGVPTAAVQAGVVLGEGSASYTMLRTLAERLPGSVGPRWLQNRIQPIHVDDVVHYLVRAADLPERENRTFDVGGPDVLSYAEMMSRYAQVMGLGVRPSVTAPVWTPQLASQWIALVTPIKADMARPLIESLHHDNVVSERDLDALVGPPDGGLTGFEEAVRRESAERDQYRWPRVLGSVGAAVLTAGALSALVAGSGDAHWFRHLSRPSRQLPEGVVGPLWLAADADLAIVVALHLIDLLEEDRGREARALAAVLAANLTLTAGWSLVLTRAHRLGLAAGVSAALTATSAELVRRVAERPQRGVVLAPYAAWTALQAALSAELWRRNR